jgi:hypothetical protein
MSRFRGGWGARPENALKRAEELENVGQKAAALQSLRDVITSKRSRANWSKTYEDIMFKLMDLCVEMKRRNDAKEALMQYRNMCQQVNINSLEEVIKYFLTRATEKAEEARAQAEVRAHGRRGDGSQAVGGGRGGGGSSGTRALLLLLRRRRPPPPPPPPPPPRGVGMGAAALAAAQPCLGSYAPLLRCRRARRPDRAAANPPHAPSALPAS